jgi:hypothetical protein
LTEEKRKILTTLDGEDYRVLKEIGVQTGHTVASLVREAVKDWLRRKQRKVSQSHFKS